MHKKTLLKVCWFSPLCYWHSLFLSLLNNTSPAAQVTQWWLPTEWATPIARHCLNEENKSTQSKS